MKARVTNVQIQPGKIDEATGIYRDSVVPAASQQKGFKGAFLLTDPDTGKGFSVTFWETDADMNAGETSGYYREQIGKFGGVFSAPPTREVYDVSIKV
ncbi:MAG TPA: antibiotic biosynthesis monooxygenase [Anaerolineales bacterium]|jgi:heme-degrading monooxygenase HmoA